MRFALAFLVAVLPVAGGAAEPAASWRWYYSAYGSPASDAKVFVRTGVANVAIDGATLRIEFTNATPGAGEKSNFVGKVEGARVSGRLTKFFPSGDESRQGEYKERRIANCKWRQISILPEYPDGSVLVVSRVEGACQ